MPDTRKTVHKNGHKNIVFRPETDPLGARTLLTAARGHGTVMRYRVGESMSVRRLCFVLTLIGSAIYGLADTTPAGAANWLEKNFWLSGPRYSGKLPPCDSGLALAEIQSRFGHKEARFWNSSLQITNFDRIQETANRPWSSDTIPRRFCSGRALLSDGIWRPVHYLIGEDMGMIGASWGVEWCVVGVDRNWANNPACRMMRP